MSDGIPREGPGISIHTVGATSARAPSAFGTSPIDGGGRDRIAVLMAPSLSLYFRGRGNRVSGGRVSDGIPRERPGIPVHTVGVTSVGAPSAYGISPIDGGGKDQPPSR